MKVKSDHRSKFSNLINWKEEAWKHQGFNGIRKFTAMITLHFQLQPQYKYEFSIISLHGNWIQQIELAPNVWLQSSVGRASHRYREVTGSKPLQALIFSGFFLPIAYISPAGSEEVGRIFLG